MFHAPMGIFQLKSVENAALTTKGLKERNTTCEWVDGEKYVIKIIHL